MKLIWVKNYILKFFLWITIVLTVILGLAICGKLSDNKEHINQNVLGGYGAIKTADRSRGEFLPIFYDDTNIYYSVQETSATEEIGSIITLYSKNIETGVSQPVCQRILCRHDTIDCPLNHLYDSEILNYYAIDDKIYYTIDYNDNNSKNGYEDLVLYEWDIMSDSRKSVYKFPSVELQKDEYGTEIESNLDIIFLERINEDIILAQCGGTVYLFDNNFSLQDSFYIGTGTYIVWTKQLIFWCEGSGFACYDIESKTIEEKILEKASGGAGIETSSDKIYCYENTLYFISGNMIMAYNTEDKSITEIAEISLPSHDEDDEFILWYQAVIIDNMLYYYFEESIYCINLDTMEKKLMVDMTWIPVTKVDKYLVLTWPEFALYDYDGKRVK